MTRKPEKSIDELTDAEVLERTGHGRFGPGIVGPELYERSKRIMTATGGGLFGPALTDPDFAKKQQAARVATQRGDDGPESSDEFDDDDDVDVDVDVDEDQTESTGGGAFTGNVDPADLSDPRNPWTYVTLSGAKMLAQQKGVSYAPRVKRAELIAALQAANIEPPPVPENPSAGDDE
jgi:hypothetical protein